MIRVFSILLVVSGFIVSFSPADALADSCPYCGRYYPPPMPGDEARVYQLRRDHERNCPSRPSGTSTSRPAGPTTYGVVTIYNRSDQPVTLSVQSFPFTGWKQITVNANGWHYRYRSLPARFLIRLDGRTFPVGYNTVRGREPNHQDGRPFEITTNHRNKRIIADATRDAVASFGSYGVVTLKNTSDDTIPYRIKNPQTGGWQSHELGPGGSSFHSIASSDSFEIDFDGSFVEGIQRKHYSLDHNTVEERSPTNADGKYYAFRVNGNDIDLFSSTRSPDEDPEPSDVGNQPDDSPNRSFNGTFTGMATGQTKGGRHFPRARGVTGHRLQITSFPRNPDKTIPTYVSNNWSAKRVPSKDSTSPENNAFETQYWEIRLGGPDFRGTAIAARVMGGAGWAKGAEVRTVNGWVKFKFQIQFSGSEVTLSEFVPDYDPGE